MCFLTIPTAAGGFFLSAWLTMIFWGIIAPDFDVKTIGYTTAMLITIGIWLVVAPLILAAARGRK